jgi:hypothetical protein
VALGSHNVESAANVANASSNAADAHSAVGGFRDHVQGLPAVFEAWVQQ